MPRRPTTLSDYRERLLRAERLVEERLDEQLDPAALAGAAHLSLHHFHRIFRAQMGETIMQHVRRLRLERAARKLRAGDPRVVDLAFEAGYESHEAFTRAFVERFGVPPSQFAKHPPDRLSTWQRARPEAPAVPVEVRAVAAEPVAFMRHRGSYARVHETWRRMIAWAEARGLLGSQPVLYGLCPDDPDVTAEDLLRFDACVAVPPGFTGDGEVGRTEVPRGLYAVGVHRGPYHRLADTYLDVIGRWVPSSGHELTADPVVEHYLDDPRTVPEADLRTEVRVRLAE